MASVYRKVMVAEKHVGKWMFYLTPTGFQGFGKIEAPSVVQGLYRVSDTYASIVLEEIELPTEEEIYRDCIWSASSNRRIYNEGANYIKDHIEKGGKG